MRDDRFKGSPPPRKVSKLFSMAERAADRAYPERLSRQALRALVSELEKNVTLRFKGKLRALDAPVTLFDKDDLTQFAMSKMDCQIANIAMESHSLNSVTLARMALLECAECYAEQLKICLIAELRSDVKIVVDAVRLAFEAAASDAARMFMSNQSLSRRRDRIGLGDNLLSQHPGSAA